MCILCACDKVQNLAQSSLYRIYLEAGIEAFYNSVYMYVRAYVCMSTYVRINSCNFVQQLLPVHCKGKVKGKTSSTLQCTRICNQRNILALCIYAPRFSMEKPFRDSRTRDAITPLTLSQQSPSCKLPRRIEPMHPLLLYYGLFVIPRSLKARYFIVLAMAHRRDTLRASSS